DSRLDRAGETLEADTRALCAFGPRVTGSDACTRAEEWAAARFRESGLAVRLESWEWPGRPPGTATPRNVVAELPGRDRPGEIVLLAAHLDTTAGSVGANDDAVNVALVLGAARAIRAAGPARRSLRFVLFTGEEEKLLGSRAYVKAHESELGAHILAVVFDLGSGRMQGFYMNGRKEDLRALFKRALSARAAWRGLFGLYTIWDGADSFSFVEAGVPVLTGLQDLEPYRAVHHSEKDTVETVDFAASRANAVLAAALVDGVADDPAPAPRRMTPQETAALLARHRSGESPPDLSASARPTALPGAEPARP
ncbi:MAG TPA: M28 family peptidase, partial [Thermoanaerobaculia bacterium]|nr:M28 family peptidase [Thermoanaerobaculia bacterium]